MVVKQMSAHSTPQNYLGVVHRHAKSYLSQGREYRAWSAYPATIVAIQDFSATQTGRLDRMNTSALKGLFGRRGIATGWSRSCSRRLAYRELDIHSSTSVRGLLHWLYTDGYITSQIRL